jgi:hypothetical protein
MQGEKDYKKILVEFLDKLKIDNHEKSAKNRLKNNERNENEEMKIKKDAPEKLTKDLDILSP